MIDKILGGILYCTSSIQVNYPVLDILFYVYR